MASSNVRSNVSNALMGVAKHGGFTMKVAVYRKDISALVLDGFEVTAPKLKAQDNRMEVTVGWCNATQGLALTCKKQAEKAVLQVARNRLDKHLSQKRRTSGIGRIIAIMLDEELDNFDDSDEDEEV